MSVAGIDFGNLNMLIAQTAKGGVDVILNDSSNRQTATAVSVQGKERFIGDSGAALVSLSHTALCWTVLNCLLFVGSYQFVEHYHGHEASDRQKVRRC